MLQAIRSCSNNRNCSPSFSLFSFSVIFIFSTIWAREGAIFTCSFVFGSSELGRRESKNMSLSVTVRRSCTSLFDREGFRERKLILYSEQWAGVWNRTHCVLVLYIPGSLFFQGFCRFGSLVDNFLSTVLLHVSLLRRHLWLQRLLRLLVTMAPASATLRGQAQKTECANQHVTERQQLADKEQINDMFEIVWMWTPLHHKDGIISSIICTIITYFRVYTSVLAFVVMSWHSVLQILAVIW